MKRFATALLAAVLVVGLSFPAPALAARESASDALAMGQATAGSSGHAWYVATTGSDDNPGTLGEPFATISHAVSQMEGGDTVFVRGGTYREEVAGVPSGSEGHPSTICAYNGEEVCLTGGEPIVGWTRTEGDANIWVADMGWDMRGVTEYSELGRGEDGGHYATSAHYGNLVFAGGSPAPEGRWPNATVDQFLDRDRYAVADRANGAAIVDADLPDGVDFTGAEVWVAAGGGYESQTATITGYQPDDRRLLIKSNSNSGWMYNPQGGNYYYVTNSLKTLDSAGEWYKDREAGRLYLYEPDGVDPNGLAIEAQRRAHAIRVGYGRDSKNNIAYEEASYITFRGIDVRLGGVAFGPQTSHCIFEQGTVDCPDHKLSSQAYGVATGILLSGTDNLVTRCEVKHAYGSAVTLWGSRNSFVNNHVHDAGYEHHEEQAAIRIGGSGQLISHNSVHHVMSRAVSGFFKSSVISYNDLYDCMRVSRDGGVVYFNAHDYGNTEFHHNWLHDTRDFPANQMHVGLYMDSFTTSLVVYRNVVWGIQNYEKDNRSVNNNGKHLTYQINPNSLNNVIANNTFVNYRPTHLNFYPNHDISGTVFLNNIYQSLSFIDGPTYYPWNWTDKWDRRSQKSIGGVKRDILAEMGAWLDSEHTLEGVFRNNTWPPIENQWNDPANGDFTLAEGSRAIDAGCEIEGITEGFVGEAPDLGAYERGGETWTPGCDLEVDYAGDLEADRAFNEKIPYRNLLANRGFEDWSPAQADGFGQDGSASFADFADWVESGTPQVGDSMSAWGYWGWITKEGSCHAVLDSNGDALTQHVSGLKKNTAYRLGGYGFVAGEFVRPKRLTSAENAAGAVADSALSSLRRGNPMSLNGLTKLQFDGVDFGQGRNRIVIGLRNPKVNSGDDKQVVSVALGSPDNVVGSYEVTERLTTAEISWRWATIELDKTYTGIQSVYLVLSGSFSSTYLAGFIPDCLLSTDALSISARRPDGTVAGKATISSLFKPFEGSYYAPHSTVVRTDATGELDVKVAMRGSDLVGYADEIFLSELPGGENFGNASACSHVFKKATCEPAWDWTTLDDTDYFDAEHTGVVTLSCAECGKRIPVEAPTTSTESGREVVCRASYAVVDGTVEAERSFAIPHYTVSVGPSEHGALRTVESARRGVSIDVAEEPDEGYALASLSYTRAGKAAVDIFESRSFAMPAADVTLNATFEPAFSIRSVPGQTYTGSAIQPIPRVFYGDDELVAGVDFIVSYENNVDIGTARVTAIGQGGYAGSSASAAFEITPADIPFEIVPIDISRAKVSGLPTAVYSGSAFTPAPTVSLGDAVLVPDVDYAVSYEGNVNAGTATVTVTGKGSYGGSAQATFIIEPADISDANVSGLSSMAYTGKALAPAPTVELDGTMLKEGMDYSISYEGNVNAGTATVTVTGRDNYGGCAQATFEVKPADISSAKVSGLGTATYTGKALAPAPTVKLGGTTLKKGLDYTVVYRNNVKAGTATAVVTGKGNYTGSTSGTFKIAKCDNAISVRTTAKTLKAKSLAKARRAVKPIAVSGAQGFVTYVVKSGSKFLSIAKATGKVFVRKGTAKGPYTAKVAVKAAGDSNHRAKTVTVIVKVNVR